ncbi:MAG: M16 family metallopeptidase [Planctomycetales bacterium]
MLLRPALLRFALVAGSCLSLAPDLFAAEPQGIARGESIEGFTEYRLDNGLRVLLFPDDSKPTVTVNITYFVGSRHEGYGETGMAHLLEHMLFKGTPTHANIPAALKERGGNFNGTTSDDRTNYYETLPASQANLEFALRLEADRMVNSHVAAADLKSEMTVVRNEFEMGENNPLAMLFQRMMAVAFEWHNYGKSTIGNRSDIERVPIENLQDFYRRYYRPDNALLIVAGQFDADQALQLVAKFFGPLPRPEQPLRGTYTDEPTQDGERIVRLRRVGTVPIVGLTYHIPAGGHPEFPAVEILQRILTTEVSGRLYKSVVETKQAAQVMGMTASLHDPGALVIIAQGVAGEDSQKLLSSMLKTIDDLGTAPVTQAEVDRVRAALMKERELAAANSTQLAVQLSEWAAQGDWRLYFLHRDRLEKVTPEEVTAAARFLKADNRTVGLFEPTASPDRVTVPPLTDLAEALRGYQGREEVAGGEQFDVSPANIDARTKRLTLRSGVQGALLEKKTRGNSVTLRLTLRYGALESLQGKGRGAALLPELMTRGTKELSRQQIEDELDRLRAELSASGRAGEATFSIQARRQTLPAVLKLLRHVLREPTFPAEELDLLKQSKLPQLEEGLTDPQMLAVRAARRHAAPYPPDDPRYLPTVAEEIEQLQALTPEGVRALYEKFLGGNHGELAIVGDFDPSEVLPAVEELLGGWKSPEKYVRIPRGVTQPIAGGKERILTPDKQNAVYFAIQVFPMRDNDPDYAALELGNFILGGGGLSSRLADRVRQKEGLSYGIGSQFHASALDPEANLFVFAISNPPNMAKVETAIGEEVARLLKEGVADQELSDASQGWLQEQQVERSEDLRLAEILAGNLVAGRTMEYFATLETKIGALTKDDVRTALRKRIDPKKVYVVMAGDFEKGEGGESSKPAKGDRKDGK